MPRLTVRQEENRKEDCGEKDSRKEDHGKEDGRKENNSRTQITYGEEGGRRMIEASVIGAGLAGCEAAYQLAERGIHVTLYEMKPQKHVPSLQHLFHLPMGTNY